MKTLYCMNNQWKLVNDKMEYTNMYLDTLHYGEISEDVEITFQNFQYAIDTFANKSMRPQVRYTAFHKNPYLFFHIDGGFDYWTMHKRTFKPFCVSCPLLKKYEVMDIQRADDRTSC